MQGLKSSSSMGGIAGQPPVMGMLKGREIKASVTAFGNPRVIDVEISAATEIMGLADWRAAPMATPMAERVHDLLIRAADGHPWMSGAKPMAEFARLDGFDSYEAFWAFHDRHRARRADTRSMTRELIGFDRIAEEFSR